MLARRSAMALTLGIDIGTTSTIGILIDTDGKVLALASQPVTLSSPQAGWAEEDPAQWWRNVCAVVPELLRQAGVDAAMIGAVGTTGMLPAVVLLDAAGALLRPSIQQSDGRTGAEVRALAAECDEAAFLRRTGNGINQQLVATKLRWLARHEPDIFARIATVFGSYDYVNWRLTGQRHVEANWALEAGFVDLASGALADDLIALGGVPRGAIPPQRRAHEIIGVVNDAAAAATGLAAGTPVSAGCADHIASAFVAGITRPGDVLLKFGGAGDILFAVDTPRPDRRLFLDHHIVPGLFMPNGCMAASGAALNWIARELGGGASHQELDQRAAEVAPGAAGLVMLPYLLGEKTPIHDPDARGTLVGLDLSHTIAHVWRAALEAVCFGFRHHLAVMDELAYPILEVRASDGGANSAIWMQIAADVINRPLRLLHGHPGSCLGAAYVAGVAIGAIRDWTAIDRFVTPAATLRPRADAAQHYDRVYGLCREIYTRLRPVFPRLR